MLNQAVAFDFEVLAERLVENKQPPKLVVLPMNPRLRNRARHGITYAFLYETEATGA